MGIGISTALHTATVILRDCILMGRVLWRTRAHLADQLHQTTYHIMTSRDGNSSNADLDFDGHYLFSQTARGDNWFSNAYNAHPKGISNNIR